jgi:iron complex outermembrane receptor protein
MQADHEQADHEQAGHERADHGGVDRGRFRSRGWLLLLWAVGGAAQAQVRDAAPAGLEQIIVTARKVEENLQDTPIAITAFTGEALAERQVFDTSTLDDVVPNLQFANNAPLAGNNSSSQVFIRGIGQTDPTSTVDPGVGLYVDEVYIGSAVGATMALRDVASVQVLRGPQGTLFGRNTIGGAILLTTQDPGSEFGGTLRTGIGSDSLLDGFLAVDVPFSDTLRSRISIGVRNQEGYVKRTDGTDLGDTDAYTALAKFVWTPVSWLKGTLSADYTSSDENGTPLVFAAINESATFARVASFDAGCPGQVSPAQPVPMVADDRCANDLQARGKYRSNGTLPLSSTLDAWGTSLNLAFALNDRLTLKAIGSYREMQWDGVRDADNTPLTILHTIYAVKGHQSSKELQLTYQSAPLTGVVGLYYFDQVSNDIATIELNTPAPGIQRDSDNNIVDNSSFAVFTQWTYEITEQLSLTAGGRYTEDRKGSFPDQFDFATPNLKQVPKQQYRASFSSFTPSGSVSYRFNDQVMTYVSYAEGFKGGGFNSHFNAVLTPTQQAALQKFRQEEARTYEAGVKLDLLDNTLRLNAAVFTADYTDMQITFRGPAPNGVAPFLTNAGKASIEGAELEATWVPGDFLIEASVGYLDAQLDDLDNVPMAVLPPGLQEGNALPFAPQWQAHLGLSYTQHLGRFELTPRVDLSYKDTTQFDATNTREIAQLGGVTTANASLVFGSGARWRVTLGVNNLSDEQYPIAGNSSLTTGSGYAEIAYSRPREYFGNFSYDF